jgi:hypothetical protein
MASKKRRQYPSNWVKLLRDKEKFQQGLWFREIWVTDFPIEDLQG